MVRLGSGYALALGPKSEGGPRSGALRVQRSRKAL
jgi:hypothetical protein